MDTTIKREALKVSPPQDKYLSASREELDIDLNVIEGELPTDLYGHVYANSAVGTVDSGGLPFTEGVEDYGSPIFNGDGYVIRFDFDEKGKVKLRSRIMKTPSYWADYALRVDGPARNDPRFDGFGWHFRSTGMARFSIQLGQCNQLNVAVLPVQFDEDGPIRMLATYEAGRPWEFDPESMEVKAPILKNDDTYSLIPEWLWRYPFKVILSTAHPLWDARTMEVFVVNYLKSAGTLIGFYRILLSYLRNPKETKEKITKAAKAAHQKGGEEGLHDFERFVMDESSNLSGKEDSEFKEFFTNLRDKAIPDDAVFLSRWDGTPDTQQWRVQVNGKDITIRDNMHQMGITENYVILSDSSFKMNLSLMFNFIQPLFPELEEDIRSLLTFPMQPNSRLYFVKRSDLREDVKTVQAVQADLPLECVHFMANYKEENGNITVMTANNTANCPAEWMRYFDKVKATGEPVDLDYLGYLSVGPMDIGRVGRFVFDARTGAPVEEKTSVLFEKGNLKDVANIGAHTWAVGLYAFRGYDEVGERKSHLGNMYWQIYGLDRDHMTEFIFDLYKHYPNREVSVEDVERLSKTGVPIGLARVDHSAPELKIEDYYLFEPKHNIRSIQFLPRATRNEAVPEDMDGYILCTLIVPLDLEQNTYRSEVWMWDAANLEQGPICKLHHPKFRFAYTFHSVFVEKAEPTNPPSQIDVIDDLDDQIKAIANPIRQAKIEGFMDEFVYPHFVDQQNAIADPDPKDYTGAAYKWLMEKLRRRKK